MTSKKRTRVAVEHVDSLRVGLEALMPAEQDTLSRRETLAELWQTVAAARKRGCSIADIHDYLKKTNICFDCSTETLRRDFKTIAEEEAKKAAEKPRRKGRPKRKNDDERTAGSSSTSGQIRNSDAADQQSDEAQRSAEATLATTATADTAPAGSASSGPRTPPSDNAQRVAPAISAKTQSKEVSAARPGSSDPRAKQTDEPAQADMFAAAESEAAAASSDTRPKSGGGDAELSSGKESHSRALCASTHGGEDR